MQALAIAAGACWGEPEAVEVERYRAAPIEVDDTALHERRGLAMVLNADGFGTQELKRVKYHAFTRSPRRFFGEGFKLFYREDTNLMTPRQVLRLRPPPDVVVYE